MANQAEQERLGDSDLAPGDQETNTSWDSTQLEFSPPAATTMVPCMSVTPASLFTVLEHMGTPGN